jgi:hypothetical protein
MHASVQQPDLSQVSTKYDPPIKVFVALQGPLVNVMIQ